MYAQSHEETDTNHKENTQAPFAIHTIYNNC